MDEKTTIRLRDLMALHGESVTLMVARVLELLGRELPTDEVLRPVLAFAVAHHLAMTLHRMYRETGQDHAGAGFALAAEIAAATADAWLPQSVAPERRGGRQCSHDAFDLRANYEVEHCGKGGCLPAVCDGSTDPAFGCPCHAPRRRAN
jgi:hypothetical protein